MSYQLTRQHNNIIGNISRFVAFICSISLFITVAINKDFLLLGVVCIYLFFMLLIIYILTSRKTFLSPVFFSILISIGFIIKLSVQIANKSLASQSGFLAIGTFGFSLGEMVGLFFVIVCGFSGVLVGVISFEKFTKKGINFIRFKQNTKMLGGYSGVKTLTILWFVFYSLLILIMWKLGIGRHGFSVTEEQALPFKLVGIMSYLRDMYFAMLTFVIMDIFLIKRKYSSIMAVFLLFFLLLTFISMVSFSRGVIIVPISLFGIFVIANYRLFNLRLSPTFCICAILFVVIMVIASIVNSIRAVLYETGLDSGLEIATMLTYISGIDFQQTYVLFIDTLTSRVEGTRELMAVYSSSVTGIGAFWEAFSAVDTSIFEDVFGFSMAQEGRAYGVTLGMLGLLFLSKSFFVVFIGSILYTYMFMTTEYIFAIKGCRITAFYVSAIIITGIWMNFTWFFIIRTFAMIALLYLTIILIERRKGS